MSGRPWTILFWYVESDAGMHAKLADSLAILRRDGMVSVPTTPPASLASLSLIQDRLAVADIVIPVLSRELLADPTFDRLEAPIQLFLDGAGRVMPFLARECVWETSFLAGREPFSWKVPATKREVDAVCALFARKVRTEVEIGWAARSASWTETPLPGGGPRVAGDLLPGTDFRWVPCEEEVLILKRKASAASRGFWMAETPVTQRLWSTLRQVNPSGFLGPDLPVERVTWIEAVEFANALSRRAGLTGSYIAEGPAWRVDPMASGYRLPTEEQWRVAAASDLADPGLSRNVSARHTRPVHEPPANALGLRGLCGNVWEWAWDAYAASYRLALGGSWREPRACGEEGRRTIFQPRHRSSTLGFRLVLPDLPSD